MKSDKKVVDEINQKLSSTTNSVVEDWDWDWINWRRL